jgi:hypothetical protein
MFSDFGLQALVDKWEAADFLGMSVTEFMGTTIPIVAESLRSSGRLG